jgi:solute carrier family 35 protein F1/2
MGFAMCMFGLYSLSPYMVAMASATLFNLSILTSDGFAVIAGVFIFGNKVERKYMVYLTHLFYSFLFPTLLLYLLF